jgi:hypothetical protein
MLLALTLFLYGVVVALMQQVLMRGVMVWLAVLE